MAVLGQGGKKVQYEPGTSCNVKSREVFKNEITHSNK